MVLGLGVRDCSLGFYGNLQVESLEGYGWLDVLDRLAWVLQPKVMLYSNINLE